MYTSLAIGETDDDREYATPSDPKVASPRGQHDGRSLARVAELIADHLRLGERLVASVRIQDIEAITNAMVLARRAPSSITHVKALLRGSLASSTSPR